MPFFNVYTANLESLKVLVKTFRGAYKLKNAAKNLLISPYSQANIIKMLHKISSTSLLYLYIHTF